MRRFLRLTAKDASLPLPCLAVSLLLVVGVILWASRVQGADPPPLRTEIAGPAVSREETARWLDGIAARFEKIRREADRQAEKCADTERRSEILARKALAAGERDTAAKAQRAAANARKAKAVAESQRARASRIAGEARERARKVREGSSTFVGPLVTSVSGDVQIRSGGKWAPFSDNGPVFLDWRNVRTGVDGRVALELRGGTVTTAVGPGSEVSVAGTTLEENLELLWGILRCKVQRFGHKFEVHTTTAVIAVRGTDFWTLLDRDGALTVEVIEGVVDVSDSRGQRTVPIAAGQRTNVRPGMAPEEPTPLPQERSDEWWELDSGEDR